MGSSGGVVTSHQWWNHLEAVFRFYGFGFRDYARTSVQRRIWNVVRAEQLTTVSGLQEKILHDATCFERFLMALSVNVSSMFRDPGFFQAFRAKAVPLLRTYPFVRIWQAGCSTGEEVYSMAILLQEEGLYERCRIYATDINEEVLRKAKAAIYPMDCIPKYRDNYVKAGGKKSFANYYTSGYDHAILDSSCKQTSYSPSIIWPLIDASTNSMSSFAAMSSSTSIGLCKTVFIVCFMKVSRLLVSWVLEGAKTFGSPRMKKSMRASMVKRGSTDERHSRLGARQSNLLG